MRQHGWTHDGTGLRWRKSSRSGSHGDNCVEVARTASMVHVRDSTDRDGGRLRVPPRRWTQFTDAIRSR